MLNLPSPFLNRMKDRMGEEYNAFLESFNDPPPVSVRINPFKSTTRFNSMEKVPWATGAFYLPSRISFTLDPLFHSGSYYVQEASSMFLEQALHIAFADGNAKRILDLCAAPGGKSTHIASLMPEGSLLVSNEMVPARNNILRYNLTKWGSADVVVTQNEAGHLAKLRGFFDVIVVDAPCSGEGLFRKDPDAVVHWSEENVAMCALRQKSILDDIYPALKAGGYLIYSTCTYEKDENEMQVRRLTDERSMELVNLGWFPEEGSAGTRFYPHRTKGEGFFISMLRKTAEEERVKIPEQKKTSSSSATLSKFLSEYQRFRIYERKDEVYAIPSSQFNEMIYLADNFFVRKAGIHLGTKKGNDFIPSHELALCNFLNDEVSTVELNTDQALTYLRCETLQLPDVSPGWIVVTFEGFALGWIKAVGRRVNNYFPRAQRIMRL